MADRPKPLPKPTPQELGLFALDELTYNGQKVDLNYYLTADYTDISQAALELPNVIEFLNGWQQELYEQKLNADAALAKAEGQAFFDLKGGTFQEIYGSKPTDKSLQHAVNIDEGVQQAWKKVNNLSAWVRRLGATQSNLVTKLDLIRSSEATRRRLIDPAELELDRKRGKEDRDGD